MAARIKPDQPAKAKAPRMSAAATISGQCLCGAVEIDVDVPVFWAWHDHSAASRIDADRTLKDPGDLAIGAAQQVNDLDRVAVHAQRIAHRQQHCRCQRQAQQGDQRQRQPLQRLDRAEH